MAEELRDPPSSCEDWTPTQGWATKWEKTRRPFSSCLGLATVRARAHKPYVPLPLIRWRRRTFSFWTSDWRLFPRLSHVRNGRCFPLPGRVAPDWPRDARTQRDSPSNVAVGGVPGLWAELRLRFRSPSCCILTGPRFCTGTAPKSPPGSQGRPFPVRVQLVQPLPRSWAMFPQGSGVCAFPDCVSCHPLAGLAVAARGLHRLRARFSGVPFRPVVIRGSSLPEWGAQDFCGNPLGKWRKQFVIDFIDYMLKWHLCSFGRIIIKFGFCKSAFILRRR